MKFVSNHPKKFDFPLVVYFLGCGQVTCAIMSEFVNIIVLINREEVYYCISVFVALTALIDLQWMFFDTMTGLDQQNVLFEVFEDDNQPKIENRNKDIKFSERPLKWKIARIIYKFFRGFYVTFIFYWTPFIFTNFMYARMLINYTKYVDIK